MAQEELDLLHVQVRTCIACPLSKTRLQAVPGSGPATARVMAVGEAPGKREDETGQPFVGAAGKLLNELFANAGIPREQVYITNTVRCRPPGNRDPEPNEVAACSYYLDTEIDEIIRPDVILLLGRHALGRLLPGQGPISSIHGKKIVVGNRTYVPLFHPAAALYNGSLKETLQNDMMLVRKYLDEAVVTD